MRPALKSTTLVCADTTRKVEWSLKAIEKSIEQCDFAAVKLLTNRTDLNYAVKIPEIKGLDGYSNFCVRDLTKYVDTPFALIIQYDGFVLNGSAWTDDFQKYDYIGAPTDTTGRMMNGGFSLRSKRLLDFSSKNNWPSAHPEDFQFCLGHRAEIESVGMKFAPIEVSRKFSMEGRSFNSIEWSSTKQKWNGEFGWHSLLTKLPEEKKPCKVFVHSGDAGDTIYSLATLKALGGGMLFITPHNNFPFPMNSRWARSGGAAEFVDNLAPLIEEQPYIVGCRYTHGQVYSCDYDLNRFRMSWGTKTPDMDSIYRLHGKAFGLNLDEKPWLTVNDPIAFPNYPIVVSRTPRYRNSDFRWDAICEKHRSQMIFVGTEDEHLNFSGFVAPHKIPHFKTKNLLHMARVIAGAKVFIGNQSSPLAIALGLGKNSIVEEWPLNANCRLKRDNAIYVLRGSVEIPKSWL